MLRLAHRTLWSCDISAKIPSDYHDLYAKAANEERAMIAQSPVIDAQNVVEYYAASAKHEWDIEDDFPNVAPPFDSFFVEYQIPPALAEVDLGLQLGWLFWSVDPQHVIDWLSKQNGSESASEFSGQARWALTASAWATSRICRGRAIYQGVRVYLLIGSDGRILKHFIHTRGMSREESLWFCSAAIHAALLTICFMHCKNVIREDTTESIGPCAKWLRRQKQPTLKYYTLQIEPMKQVLREHGASEQTGLKKALHICRGHFAHYTEEKPLFGRLSGTFWKPAHTRGTLESGAVVKDYSVTANNS